MPPKSTAALRGVGAAMAIAALCVIAGSVHAADVGDEAPAFALPTADGATIALAGLRGQVVYVDFWASWCGPCRRSFPWMNEIQQRYGGRGLMIVAINVDAKRDEADRFLRQFPASFPVVFDSAGVAPATYGVKGMPSSYIVDRQGRIVGVEQGFLDARRAALEEKIRSLVAAR